VRPELRRPGARWRLLVHEWAGRVSGQRDGMYGAAHSIASDTAFGGKVPDGEHYKNHLFENTEFDELTVGRWLHIEQMDHRVWWMNIAGITVHATVDRDGRPLRVWVSGPYDYDEPVPDCRYELTWTNPEQYPKEQADGR